MNIDNLQNALSKTLEVTESPSNPMRGPYQALPRISIVSNASAGYKNLSSDFMFSATRPLLGQEVTGKHDQFYYPVGFVHVDLSKPDHVAENLSLDASFIAAMDDQDYQNLCESLIEPRYRPLYSGLGEDKKRSVIESIAKNHLKSITVQNALEVVHNFSEAQKDTRPVTLKDQPDNEESEEIFSPAP